MAIEDDLRARVMRVLTSNSAQKIDFTLGPCHVDYAGFWSVSHALLMKQLGYPGIGINVGEALPAGAKAAYDYGEDTLKFPNANYGKAPLEQAAIIHECVHAMRDIWGGTLFFTTKGPAVTTYVMDEAVAHVAEMLFLLLEGYNVVPDDALRTKAYEIAKSIKNVKGAVVSNENVTSMQDLVTDAYKKFGVTRDTPSLADGL